jgi:hypothetical protein
VDFPLDVELCTSGGGDDENPNEAVFSKDFFISEELMKWGDLVEDCKLPAEGEV